MQCVMDINPMSSLKVTYHSTCTCQPQPIPPVSWRPRGAVFPSPICLPRASSLLALHCALRALPIYAFRPLPALLLARAGRRTFNSFAPACLEAYCPPSLFFVAPEVRSEETLHPPRCEEWNGNSMCMLSSTEKGQFAQFLLTEDAQLE